MTTKEIEEYFRLLRENEKLCSAITFWAEEECKKLENPKYWNRENFEIEGKSNMMTAKKLRLLILKVTKIEIKKLKNKTSYK